MQGVQQFQTALLPLFLSCFQDQVHAVRMTATRCLEPLSRSCGDALVQSAFLPRLLEIFFAEGSSYLQRVTVLYGLRELCTSPGGASSAVVDSALPVLLRATQDPVPNVRAVAACVLGDVVAASAVPPARVTGDVRDALTALAADPDPDARYAAQVALEKKAGA